MILLLALCASSAAFFGTLAVTGTPVSFRLPGKVRHRRNGDWLAQAQVSAWTFRGVSAGCAAAMLLVCWAVSGSVIVGLVPGIIALLAPKAWWQHQAQRREAEIVEAWPNAIRHLLSSLEARSSVQGTLEDLSRSGPEPFRKAFARYPVLARTLGAQGALRVIRDQLADPVSDLAIEILIVALAQGTNEALVILREMDDEIVADLRTLAEVRAEQYEPRLVAKVAFAFPWALLVLLCWRVRVIRDVYASGAAIIPIIVAGVIGLTALAVVRRLVRDAAEPRVLGGSP